MKTIVMWWKDREMLTGKEPGPKTPSYLMFFNKLSVKNNLYFADGFDAYKGGNTFSVKRYANEELSAEKEDVEAQVVYHYSKVALPGQYNGTAPITNTPEFKEFCADKWATCEYLTEFHPRTFLVTNESELAQALTQINTENVVLKPCRGLNGIDVIISKKNAFEINDNVRRVLAEKGAVVQEFINTVGGVSGVCPSHHDLRVITINDKVSFTHVRQPAVGSLVANMHQGASGGEIEFEQLPEVLQKFYHDVHARVRERYPRAMYSMDFGLGKDGPKLFELNGHTAFPAPHFSGLDRFIENLIEHLETI